MRLRIEPRGQRAGGLQSCAKRLVSNADEPEDGCTYCCVLTDVWREGEMKWRGQTSSRKPSGALSELASTGLGETSSSSGCDDLNDDGGRRACGKMRAVQVVREL